MSFNFMILNLAHTSKHFHWRSVLLWASPAKWIKMKYFTNSLASSILVLFIMLILLYLPLNPRYWLSILSYNVLLGLKDLIKLWCSKVFREIKVKNFDLNLFETTQVFYPSKDGTKVPMFIVHKKVCLLLICFDLLLSPLFNSILVF